MSYVHCPTFHVPDPTDLLKEIARMPVLYFDDVAMGQINDPFPLERILRLAFVHGRGVVFHVEELSTRVKFFWLGHSSAISLLSTDEGIITLYLHLSGVDPDEDEISCCYLHAISHGLFSKGQVIPHEGVCALIEFQLWNVGGQGEFVSKLLHSPFCDICEANYRQQFSRQGHRRG